MPDDIQAALSAGVVPLGFVNADLSSNEREAHRKLLLDKGAQEVFDNYDELIKYIKSA